MIMTLVYIGVCSFI